MKKVCFVTTSPLIVNFFLRGLLRTLRERYDVTLVVNTEDEGFLRKAGIDVEVRPLCIERKIAVAADLAALYRLAKYLRGERFDGIVSVAPKAGLLAVVAGWIARVPFRCHVFQGEVWANRSGPMRMTLKTLDRFVALRSTHVLVVSRSEREFLVREGVLDPQKSEVLANGSVSGVDLKRFREDPMARREVRSAFGIGDTDPMILFLGRLTRDKGVLDLARAFARLDAAPTARLVYVGTDEEGLRSRIELAAGAARARVLFGNRTARRL